MHCINLAMAIIVEKIGIFKAIDDNVPWSGILKLDLV